MNSKELKKRYDRLFARYPGVEELGDSAKVELFQLQVTMLLYEKLEDIEHELKNIKKKLK